MMRRSSFLSTAAGGIAAIALPRRAGAAASNDLAEFTLVARTHAFEPVPGVKLAGLGYNGLIPGPILRATLGQRVRIRYVNKSPIDTAVHWHGMILPNAMDGSADVTQRAVAPGESFTYEFDAKPAGTRWYHDHATLGGLSAACSECSSSRIRSTRSRMRSSRSSYTASPVRDRWTAR